jgi:hypothetical protein
MLKFFDVKGGREIISTTAGFKKSSAIKYFSHCGNKKLLSR